MQRIIIVLLALGITSLSVGPGAWADFTYEIIDLGVMHDSPLAFSAGMALNNQGHATGLASLPGLRQRAFHYDGVAMHELGDFGNGWLTDSIGSAINNHGQIVGTVAGGAPEAYFYRGPGNYELLGTLGGLTSWATDVNDSGQVVGHSRTGLLSYQHAFMWQDGVMNDLGTLGGDSAAYAVNAAGQVVGAADIDPGLLRENTQAFIWENGQMRALDPSGNESYAVDINDTGVVVGHMWDGCGSSAFCWTDGGGMSTLPTPYNCFTEATAVNNDGDIVGVALASELDPHALLWRDGEVFDLTAMAAESGWFLLDAMDINDRGWIVGSGISPDGTIRAYLLVPEPASLLLLLTGVAGICRVSRRS